VSNVDSAAKPLFPGFSKKIPIEIIEVFFCKAPLFSENRGFCSRIKMLRSDPLSAFWAPWTQRRILLSKKHKKCWQSVCRTSETHGTKDFPSSDGLGNQEEINLVGGTRTGKISHANGSFV